MTATSWRKKPVVVQAIQWTGDNYTEVSEFIVSTRHALRANDEIDIWTLEGTMTASFGDWIIRGVQGEYYPCKPDIFEATYEHADDDAANLDPAVEATALSAAGRALVPFGVDEEPDYFEYHHCEDQSNCSIVKHGEPCACAGMAWPSAAVQAAISAALAAAAPLIRSQAIAEAADLLASYAREFESPGPLYGIFMSSSRSVRALANEQATDD